MRLISVVLLFLVLLFGTFAQSAADLYNVVAPGTVEIKYELLLQRQEVNKPELVNRFLAFFQLKELGSEITLASGSGIVLSSDGLILTNRHVIDWSSENEARIRTRLSDWFKSLLEKDQTHGPFSLSERAQLAGDLKSLAMQSPIALSVQVANKETRNGLPPNS